MGLAPDSSSADFPIVQRSTEVRSVPRTPEPLRGGVSHSQGRQADFQRYRAGPAPPPTLRSGSPNHPRMRLHPRDPPSSPA